MNTENWLLRGEDRGGATPLSNAPVGFAGRKQQAPELSQRQPGEEELVVARDVIQPDTAR